MAISCKISEVAGTHFHRSSQIIPVNLAYAILNDRTGDCHVGLRPPRSDTVVYTPVHRFLHYWAFYHLNIQGI